MYTREEITKTICDILVEEFECPAEKLIPQVNLFDDLDLDSIDAVDLIIRLQRIVNKKVRPDDFKQIRTLNDLIDAVEKIVNEKTGD